jgi:hypothetical protein
MLVTVDRESVAMGDDVDSHVQTIKADPSLTVGALLGRLMHPGHPPLASVAGEVSWLFELQLATGPDRWKDRASEPLALVNVPDNGEPPCIIPLSTWHLQRSLRELAKRSTDGSVTLYFRYCMSGHRMSYAWFAQQFGA